jgi:acyl-CoA synthetase (AMP-forming)/AMP-acid ligase II
MRVASEYRATMTQGPDFAYRLCAMRFGTHSERNLKGFRTNEELLLNLSKLRSCLNASERAQHDTHFLFASTFASHGWNPKSMRAGYGLAESVVYVCDGPVRVAQINRRALEETNEAVECAPFDVRAKELDDDKTTRHRSLPFACRVAARFASSPETASALDALDPDVRVVCPETHKELPDGRVGEIWVRGGSVAFGYVDEDGFSLGAAFGVPLATGKIREKKRKAGTFEPATSGSSTACPARCSWSGACATGSKSTAGRIPRRISSGSYWTPSPASSAAEASRRSPSKRTRCAKKNKKKQSPFVPPRRASGSWRRSATNVSCTTPLLMRDCWTTFAKW